MCCPQAKRGGCGVYISIRKNRAHASLIVHHTTTISIAIFSLRESAARQYLVQPCGAGTKPVRDVIGGLFPQPRAEAFVAASLPCSPRCSAVRTTDRTYCAMLLVGLSDHHLHVMVEVYAFLNMEFSVTCSCLLNGCICHRYSSGPIQDLHGWRHAHCLKAECQWSNCGGGAD